VSSGPVPSICRGRAARSILDRFPTTDFCCLHPGLGFCLCSVLSRRASLFFVLQPSVDFVLPPALVFPRVIHFSRLILSCAGSCLRYRFPGPAWRVHCRCTCLQRARAASTLSLCEDFCRPCSSWFSFWPGLLLACERGIDLCS
jgi:hypothetical protein